MKILFALLISLFLIGCSQNYTDDDLSSQPVTNNPNIIPKTGQTALLGN